MKIRRDLCTFEDLPQPLREAQREMRFHTSTSALRESMEHTDQWERAIQAVQLFFEARTLSDTAAREFIDTLM